jgi:hypothetical protein
MRKILKRKKMVEMVMMGLRVMMRRRMKFLMLRRSTPLPTHMGTPVFWIPLNPDWREKISYKGKTYLVREKRKENLRLVEKEPGINYRFHTAFQQDFYESVIITKIKPVAISQWIDWTYIEAKHDAIFDEVVAACRAKHLRDAMSFQKN